MRIPSVAAYRRAFKKVRALMTSKQWQMLEIHLRSPVHSVTSGALGRAVGISYHGGANTSYGQLAAALIKALNTRVDPKYHVWIIATFKKVGRQWRWDMRPQVVEALNQLGWFSSNGRLPGDASVWVYKCNRDPKDYAVATGDWTTCSAITNLVAGEAPTARRASEA